MPPAVLSPTQLKKLTEHRYSAQGMSLVEPVMQVYWRWLVELIPRSWAPNTLTIVGLALNVTTAMFVIMSSPDGKQEVPPWACLVAGIGMFVYQSLDAIDGKQARRTNSATPLGELFDHGCDAISVVFVTISAIISIYLGLHPLWLFFEFFAILFLFYLAHWQAYVSGTLKFKWIDVTELQHTVILIFILGALFGRTLWLYEIYGIPLNLWLAYFSVVGVLLAAASTLAVIFMEGGVGKNRSTCADTSTVFPLIPSAGVITVAAVIALKSPYLVFQNNPVLYLTTFGFVYSKIIICLVVGHMTKSEISLWDSIFFGPAMLVVNQYFNCVLDEHLLLILCCIYCVVNLVRHCWRVCQQICFFLNIYCFSITSRPPVK